MKQPACKQSLLRLCSQGVKQQSPKIFFFTSEKNVTNARTWFKRLGKPVTQWSSYLTQRAEILTRLSNLTPQGAKNTAEFCK